MVGTAPLSTPLSTLLSQALVAFTIELDTAFEQQMPHFTAADMAERRPIAGVWLASQVMWSNFLKHVAGDGITGGDLQERACVTDEALHIAVGGMNRWGYVSVDPPLPTFGAKGFKKTSVITRTHNGALAHSLWAPLPAEIERRWRDRFGDGAIDALRTALDAIDARRHIDMPEYLPVMSYAGGMPTRSPARPRSTVPTVDAAGAADLSTLLSRVLLAIALDYECDATVTLVLAANFLRALDEDGQVTRDIPQRTGISKAVTDVALKALTRTGHIVVEPDPHAPRTKRARLTDFGVQERDDHFDRLARIERDWRGRLGDAAVADLRAALEPIVGDGTMAASPLAAGLVPVSGTWRAAAPAPDTLPHYPAVSHRGGYPDGA